MASAQIVVTPPTASAMNVTMHFVKNVTAVTAMAITVNATTMTTAVPAGVMNVGKTIVMTVTSSGVMTVPASIKCAKTVTITALLYVQASAAIAQTAYTGSLEAAYAMIRRCVITAVYEIAAVSLNAVPAPQRTATVA